MSGVDSVDAGKAPGGPSGDGGSARLWSGQARWGLIATVVWLGGIAVYSAAVFENLLELRPDEAATYFAGIFAPLAFLWLVLGFFQQGEELRNSAQALWLQGEELRNSVEQQRQLVEVERSAIESQQRAIEAQERALVNRSQPRLLIRRNGDSPGPEQSKRSYYYTIVNTGPHCTELEITGFDAGNLTLDRLENAPAYQLIVYHDAALPFTKRAAQIRYTDALATKMEQLFLIETDGNAPAAVKLVAGPRRVGFEDPAS